MAVFIFDFETYYGTKYTLSTPGMTYPDYVDDARFKVHGVAVKIDNQPSQWLPGEEVITCLENLPPQSLLVAHNLSFDLTILTRRYGLSQLLLARQFRLLDTLSLAALVRGSVAPSLQLDVLTAHSPLKGKLKNNTGESQLEEFKNKRTLTEEEWARLGEYATHDVELTRWLLDDLLQEGTRVLGSDLLRKELLAIHLTHLLQLDRSETTASLHFHHKILQETAREEKLDRTTKLGHVAKALGLPVAEMEKIIRSRTRFPELMARLGVEIPKKISKQTGKETYAMAKGDDAWQELLRRYGVEGEDG